jgi:hypothetical protein
LSTANTSRVLFGSAVPTPTPPQFVTTKFVAVDDPTANAGAEPLALVGFTDSCAHGVDVPRPTFPVKLFVFENVLKSDSSVDEADEPPAVRHVPFTA